MEATVCQDCGQPADRDAEFCPSCGAYLDWDAIEGGRGVRPVGVAPASDRTASTAEGRAALQATAATAPAPSGRGGSAGPVRSTPPVPAPRATSVPGPGGCPRCGTDNPPERRFCRKCALEFDPPSAAGGWASQARRPRLPWWRRWAGGHRTPAERRALRAYRRSLPTRYRVFRGVAAVLALGLVAAAVWAVNADPLGWARGRWYDFHDTLQPVPDVSAALDPAGAEPVRDFEPGRAVDGDPETSWATSWTGGPPPAVCSGEQRTAQRLLLEFGGGVADVRELHIRAGLPDGDGRPLQNRPKVLEVRSSNGTCQEIPLQDVASTQVLPLPRPVSTDVLLVDVVDVHPAEAGGTDLVAISDIVPWGRPPH
ncbi:hypothetical protein [Modestobacter sp. URMC 112]